MVHLILQRFRSCSVFRSMIIRSCSVFLSNCSMIIWSCSVFHWDCSMIIRSCNVFLSNCSKIIRSCNVFLSNCSKFIRSCGQFIRGCSKVVSYFSELRSCNGDLGFEIWQQISEFLQVVRRISNLLHWIFTLGSALHGYAW